MKTERAPNAASYFGATGTAERSDAPVLVQRVQPTGRVSAVYDITVEGEHEFFANGILVKNCDSALYLHRYSRNFLERPDEQPRVAPVGTSEWMTAWLKRREREASRREEDDWYGSD
jgi:hypothetical protein